MKYLIILLLFSCSRPYLSKFNKREKQRNPASQFLNERCSETLTKLLEGTNDLPSYLRDEVDLIWYPKEDHVFYSHTEIKIQDTVYDSYMWLEEKSKYEGIHRKANSGKGKAFFRFKLAVTPEELENIKRFVEYSNDDTPFQTCIGGVCNIVTKNTKIKIPFPFSQIPTLNALYLTVMQKLGYQRIYKIEYVGKRAWKDLLSSEVFTELSILPLVSGATVAFIVWVLKPSEGIVPMIVPVSGDK